MIGCRRDMPASRPIESPSGRCQAGDTMLAASSDGRTLATGGRHWRVLRWDAATRRSLEPQRRHDSPVKDALTSDGRIVITVGGRVGSTSGTPTETGFDLLQDGGNAWQSRRTVVSSLPGPKAGSSGCGIHPCSDRSGKLASSQAPSPPSHSTRAGGSSQLEGKTAPSASRRCPIKRPSASPIGSTNRCWRWLSETAVDES